MEPVKNGLEFRVWSVAFGKTDTEIVLGDRQLARLFGVPATLGSHKKYHLGAVWLLMMMLKYGSPMACIECPVYRIPLGTCVSGKAAFVIGWIYLWILGA